VSTASTGSVCGHLPHDKRAPGARGDRTIDFDLETNVDFDEILAVDRDELARGERRAVGGQNEGPVAGGNEMPDVVVENGFAIGVDGGADLADGKNALLPCQL
jgi:hypothetical protein